MPKIKRIAMAKSMESGFISVQIKNLLVTAPTLKLKREIIPMEGKRESG
jgi:hypothetical protein